MHQHPARDRYSLRNEPAISFQIELATAGSGIQGATTRATITKNDGQKFHYEVIFRGEYCQTKANFSQGMYEDTALALVCSQLESYVHQDTGIVLEVNSGLPRTETAASLNWG